MKEVEVAPYRDFAIVLVNSSSLSETRSGFTHFNFPTIHTA